MSKMKVQVQQLIDKARTIENQCTDQIVSSADVEACLVNYPNRYPLALRVKGRELTVRKEIMFGQLAGRSHVPAQYLERIIDEDPELAVNCVSSGFKHFVDGEGVQKDVKVRIYSPPGEPEILRGLVSTRYMPMSSAEILEVFAKLYPLDSMEIGKYELDEYGLILQSRSTKAMVKAKEIKVGDIFPGFSLTNNEVSLGAFEAVARLYRLACSNGMVMGISSPSRKIHLGSGDEGSKYINEYLGGQLQLLEKQVEYGAPLIENAMNTQCDIDQLYNGLKRKENIKVDQLAMMFMGWQSEKGLGKNLWGAVNGITRSARDMKEISEAHRFEKLAGTVIQMKESQIRALEAMGRSYIDEMTTKGRAILTSSN